jgi:hypothetical protein
MTEGDSGMMRGLLVIARLVKLAGLAMMFGRLFIVVRCMFMKLVNLVLWHSVLPEIRDLQRSPVTTALSRDLEKQNGARGRWLWPLQRVAPASRSSIGVTYGSALGA